MPVYLRFAAALSVNAIPVSFPSYLQIDIPLKSWPGSVIPSLINFLTKTFHLAPGGFQFSQGLL